MTDKDILMYSMCKHGAVSSAMKLWDLPLTSITGHYSKTESTNKYNIWN